MFKKLVLAGAVASASCTSLPSVTYASEWGCQVLLCLSGDWQGTPSCHPPIEKLIAAMKRPGFSWPTCPQANSGAAKYQRYEDCASGFTATDTISDRDTNTKALCVAKVPYTGKNSKTVAALGIENGMLTTPTGKTVAVSRENIMSGSHGDRINSVEYSYSKELKEKPWYIEYSDAKGQRQRTWFNLNL